MSLLNPDLHPTYLVPMVLRPQAVCERLKSLKQRGHKVSAVLVTSPTYHGVLSDISLLAEVRAASF
jgi:arginine/lysine/ornithine decarboxylase